MIWIWLIIAGIFAAPFVIEATRTPMNQKVREDAPGAFALLTQGVTHYQWFGPEDGPTVVCVHGLTTPSFVWQGVANGLALMGFRVLIYDLYGRGYSDRVRGVQDRAFFMQQLADLLANQGLKDGITLIGFSTGGAISTVFAASQPDRVHQLILLAPAGMIPVCTGLIKFAARTPLLGAWLMLCHYPSVLRKYHEKEKDRPTSIPDLNALKEVEVRRRGFFPAIRSTFQGILSENLSEDHKTLHKESVPLLAIWGVEDDTIPASCADVLKEWNCNAQNALVGGAGHGLPYTHTAEVLDHIERFTRSADV